MIEEFLPSFNPGEGTMMQLSSTPPADSADEEYGLLSNSCVRMDPIFFSLALFQPCLVSALCRGEDTKYRASSLFRGTD